MRVSFVVDGFNLYHSVKAAERDLRRGPLRWLDIRALCQTLVNSVFGPGATIESVHYFSALAKHLEHKKPDVVRRHRTFIAALESTGIEVTLAKFKKKDRFNALSEFRIRFPFSRRWFRLPVRAIRLSYRTHEEKETDVAIACKLLELLCQNRCDAVVLVTGDTDIAPAIRTARLLYPNAQLVVAFPFDRHNQDLARLAPRSIKLSGQLYQQHQFPPTFTTPKGRILVKPATW